MELKISGTPIPKQSTRWGRDKKGKPRAYTDPKIKAAQKRIYWEIKSQLPRGFKLLDGPLGAKVTFVFPYPKSKKKTFWKITKPDLTDNLWKMPFDVMEGLVYVNDSRVCLKEGKKIYGDIPATYIEIYEIK